MKNDMRSINEISSHVESLTSGLASQGFLQPVEETALLRAYHTLLMVGRYPLAVLFVDLPPEMIDVNVHPAKAEVRFRQADRVFSGVQRAVKRALLAYSPVPPVSPQSWAASQPRIGLDWSLAADASGQSLYGETGATLAPQPAQLESFVSFTVVSMHTPLASVREKSLPARRRQSRAPCRKSYNNAKLRSADRRPRSSCFRKRRFRPAAIRVIRPKFA